MAALPWTWRAPMSERRLPVSYAGHLSDRVQDLYSGVVVPQGIDLHPLQFPPVEAFRRLLRGEFHVGEMSLATYIVNVARGQNEFVALPVFPSRTFRHSAIYVRADRGIERPADLVGRVVGVPEYQMTAALWVRGLLQHEYGVKPAELSWVTGGLRDRGRRGLVDVEVEGVAITHESERTLDEMLVAGELDAIVAPQPPPSFLAGAAEVRRLFTDYRTAEQEYYRATGLFPIMHLVVVRRVLYDEHPWVAASLFDAFERAKENAFARLRSCEPLPVSLPWIQDEVDETMALMGPDFWPYGLEANRGVLEAACAYLAEQGLTDRRVDPDELFAPDVEPGRTRIL